MRVQFQSGSDLHLDPNVPHCCFFIVFQTENVREDILKLGEGVGTVEVDLMEPFRAEKSPK